MTGSGRSQVSQAGESIDRLVSAIGQHQRDDGRPFSFQLDVTPVVTHDASIAVRNSSRSRITVGYSRYSTLNLQEFLYESQQRMSLYAMTVPMRSSTRES